MAEDIQQEPTKTTTTSAEQRASGAANALDAKLSGPLAPLEKSLDDVFGSKAQYQLPANIKDLLVKLAPWLALLSGILGILGAIGLWSAAHMVNEMTSFYGAYSPAYTQAVNQMNAVFWIALIMDLIFSGLALLAFPGLKARKKVGWNLMFYSTLLSIVYSIVSGFYYNTGIVSSLIGAVIGAVIGFYILFQVRSRYTA